MWTLDSNKAELNVGAGSHLTGSLLQPAHCHWVKGDSKWNSCPGTHRSLTAISKPVLLNTSTCESTEGAGKMGAKGLP